MKKTENSQTISVYLDDEVQKRLKNVADIIGISRNRMVLNLLIIGLDEAEFLRELVTIAVFARDLRDKIRNKLSGTGSVARATDIWEKPEKTKTMPIYLDNDLLQRLKRMSDVAKINRNQLITNLLIIGLEEAEMLNRIGIVKVGVFARDLREKIRKRIKGSEEEL